MTAMPPPRDPGGRGKDLTSYPLGARSATLASSPRALNQVSVRNMMSMELSATKVSLFKSLSALKSWTKSHRSEFIFVHPHLIGPLVWDAIQVLSKPLLQSLCGTVVWFHQTLTFRAVSLNMTLSVSSVLRSADGISTLHRSFFL